MNPTKSFSPEESIRPALRQIAPYSPIVPYEVLAEKLGRHPSEIVKLDANENPFGPAPSVATALADAKYLHIYPDPESSFLRDAIADYARVPKEYIMAGAGADELIDLLFRLFVTPGTDDSIINCPPTFGMYRFDADVNGARIINVPRRSDFAVDITAIERVFAEERAPPKLLFVASPNNPDGSLLPENDLKRLLALPTVVVIDEAYFEFANVSMLSWVPSHDNLVVLRTFSKWAALAGMRVGYGAFPLPIMKHMWKIKQPYNVSVAGQVAAIASIREKHDLLEKVDRVVRQRHIFYNKIEKYQWLTPYPSQSNYVLCRVGEGRDAAQIKQQLADRGILIRYYTAPGLTDCIRISMGTERQMEAVYSALDELDLL
ncbi:histidinol-phosphate aminotransferase [Gracilaria domingensis]|nr:histidinol-phosphate aminotransferase [Gracilaria domingensis]